MISDFGRELISFSRNVRSVTEKGDQATWIVFLRNADYIGKVILFRLPFHY